MERQVSETVALLRLTQSLSHARAQEEVFTFALNALHDLFSPDRAFVAIAESKSPRTEQARPLSEVGSFSTLTIPVYANDYIAGKFILHYEKPRTFSETDIELAEIVALQSGLVIHELQSQRMRAELVAMAVHELRAPLTAITAGALLIKSGKAIPRALEMIERNAQVQERLIEELLNISRIDAGKLELQMARLDLAPLLTEIIEEIQVSATKADTIIRAELERPLFVHADAQRLRQVFTNLLGNSIRCASPNGEVRVNATQADGFVRVRIMDNGIGISAEHLPHIFERFRQANARQLHPYHGFGLGLAIVRDLVNLQGGTVTANSPGPGKGAEFCVGLNAAVDGTT
jgi:signal transduction histidine kinase